MLGCVIEKGAPKSSAQVTKSNPVPPPPPPTAPPSTTLGVSYGQTMKGLTDFFVMTPHTWPDGSSGYLSGVNGSMPQMTIVDNGNLADIESTGIAFFDLNARQALGQKIMSQYIENLFPEWLDATSWVNNAIDSCRSDGKSQVIVKGAKRLEIGCFTEMGVYTADIKHS
jgi:hypothetical protein